MCQTRRLTLSPKLLDKQIDTFHRKTRVCFSLLSVQCFGNGSLPRTISLTLTVAWDPEIQASLAIRIMQLREVPWAVATKLWN